MARIVYFGNPQIAVPPLRRLVDDGHEIALVVTGEDKRRGRGRLKSASAVKVAATEMGIEVTSSLQDAGEVASDLGVVVAFGKLIPAELLGLVPMVNLHFSALPRWRGAAPLERAILAGDETAAVCVMEVVRELDAGGIYLSETVKIPENDYLSDLRDRMVEVGSELLSRALAGGLSSLPEPAPQRGEVLYAHKLRPEELKIDWERPVQEVMRLVRIEAAWTTFRSKRLRVLKATPITGLSDRSMPPGAIFVDEERCLVGCGDSPLDIGYVQPENSRRMTVGEWVRGARPLQGERLGS
ncbi:MAG: methionyl-tRNA formyltransferase [Acidimicrobiales bacterium]